MKLFLVTLVFIFISCDNENNVQSFDSYLKLIYPKGNEYFATQDKIPIVWETNSSEPIKIEFSSNLGINWKLVVDSLINKSKVFFWSTPNVVSEYCLIKISTSKLSDSLKIPFNLTKPDCTIINLNYYPLSLGNQWVYTDIGTGSPATNFYRTVIGDTTINQKVFSTIKNEYPEQNYQYYDYERIDTLSGNVIRYLHNEEIIDNLYAKIGEEIPSVRYYGTEDSTLFEKEENIFVWNSYRNSRTYFNDGFPASFRYNLVYGIGLFGSYIHVINSGSFSDTLKACRINSVIYGESHLIK